MQTVLSALRREARRRGLNDSNWAAAAGLRKETLSRLRGRATCDFATLEALARAVGATVTVASGAPVQTTPDGHFPAAVDRDYEARLLALCTSGTLDPGEWRGAGPPFFMAGLAVILAGVRGFDRGRCLALAEALHPGSGAPQVFALWLARSPLRPSRFLPMLKARRHAA